MMMKHGIILLALMMAINSGTIAQKRRYYCVADVSSAGIFSSKLTVEMDYGKDTLVKTEVQRCFPDIKNHIFSSLASLIQSFSDCGWALVSSYQRGKEYYPRLIFKKDE